MSSFSTVSQNSNKVRWGSKSEPKWFISEENAAIDLYTLPNYDILVYGYYISTDNENEITIEWGNDWETTSKKIIIKGVGTVEYVSNTPINSLPTKYVHISGARPNYKLGLLVSFEPTEEKLFVDWYARNSISIGVTSIDDLCFSPDGRYLAVISTYSHTVVLLSVDYTDEGIPILTEVARLFLGDGVYPIKVAFSSDSSMIAVLCRQHVYILSVPNLQVLSDIYRENNYMSCAKFSPNGDYIAMASYDGYIEIIDGSNMQTIATVSGYEYVSCIEFTPDGEYLIAATNKGIVMMSVPDLDIVSELARNSAEYVAISSDGKYLAITYQFGSTIELLKLSTFNVVSRIDVANTNEWLGKISFSMDGKYLLVNGSNMVWLYTVPDLGKIFSNRYVDYSNISAIAPNNKYIAAFAGFDGSGLVMHKLSEINEIGWGF